jgi:hypothetical protein
VLSIDEVDIIIERRPYFTIAGALSSLPSVWLTANWQRLLFYPVSCGVWLQALEGWTILIFCSNVNFCSLQNIILWVFRKVNISYWESNNNCILMVWEEPTVPTQTLQWIWHDLRSSWRCHLPPCKDCRGANAFLRIRGKPQSSENGSGRERS